MLNTARHARGAYFTPRWLAELILDHAGYSGEPGVRLLDPSCGEGVFLAAAIARIRAYAESTGERRERTVERILREIHGYELNPASAEAARGAYLDALGELASELAPAEVPVRCVDAILSPPATEAFDLLAGNPPWVRWDHLPAGYRQATLPLWKHYGLFSLTGFGTVTGAGKKDLCMLFTYVAADKFLRAGGRLAFIVTEQLFKSGAAGEGFRRFQIGADGPPLGVTAVHDFVRLRPFKDAQNRTAALFATKGQPTAYPVPYTIWERNSTGGFERHQLEANPIGSAKGPWRTVAPGDLDLDFLDGPCAYKPLLGVNANPYGVFWLDVREARSEGLAEIQNLPGLGKTPIPRVSAVLETEPIFPALRGLDIQPWRAEPRVHVLLIQDPAARCGYKEDYLSSRWPRVLEYLEQFRGLLLERALYRRYYLKGKRPFYSQFNAAASVLSPFKVVWRRMAKELAAAVISTWNSPLGEKLVLPLETTTFIPASCVEEAHYLCACLNSAPVSSFLKSFSPAGRGFGTPSAIARVRLPRFEPASATHARLAAISQECHNTGMCTAALETEIEALVRSLSAH
jgi:hypothetical protein